MRILVGCVIIINLPLVGLLSYLPLSAPSPVSCLQALPEDEKVVALHTSAKHFSFFFSTRRYEVFTDDPPCVPIPLWQPCRIPFVCEEEWAPSHYVGELAGPLLPEWPTTNLRS